MTQGYEMDTALKKVEDRVRRLELATSRNKPAGGIDYNDDGGFFGGGTLTLEEIINYFGLGTAPDSFLRSKGGEVHYIDPHGVLGASSLWDLANGNAHTGELDQDCDVTPVGWPSGKRGYLAWSITGDGTSTPNFVGVTWTDAAPSVIGSGDVLHGLLWSDDTGITIWGSVAGSGGSSGLTSISDGTTVVSPVSSATVPLGGVADLSGGNASLRFLTNRYGGQPAVVSDASVSGTYDFDLSLGSWFDLTLTGDVTSSTVSNPPPGAGVIHVFVRQGAGAPYTFVWPTSFLWRNPTTGEDDGSPPTLKTAEDAQDDIEAATVDGGVSWGARDENGAAGSGGTPATTVTDETTFGITPAVGTDTEYARQDHTHGTPDDAELQVAGHWEVLMASGPTFPPEPLENGDGTDWLWAWVPG